MEGNLVYLMADVPTLLEKACIILSTGQANFQSQEMVVKY